MEFFEDRRKLKFFFCLKKFPSIFDRESSLARSYKFENCSCWDFTLILLLINEVLILSTVLHLFYEVPHLFYEVPHLFHEVLH